MRGFFLIWLLLAANLAACGEGGEPARSEEEMARIAERAAELRPANAELAAVYDRSCRNCHGVPGSGAPLTGDGAAWEPRLAKGRDALLDHTLHGFNGMPPLGMCPDCDVATFDELITFMSTDAGP